MSGNFLSRVNLLSAGVLRLTRDLYVVRLELYVRPIIGSWAPKGLECIGFVKGLKQCFAWEHGNDVVRLFFTFFSFYDTVNVNHVLIKIVLNKMVFLSSILSLLKNME